MSRVRVPIDVSGYIYAATDPCVDGFFSLDGARLRFGARRIGPQGLELDRMTRDYGPVPADADLGTALLAELALTEVPLDTGLSTGSAPAGVADAGGADWWRFSLWTHPGDVPLMLCAPTSPRYPESFHRWGLARTTRPDELGAAVRQFMAGLRGFLRSQT